MEKKLKNVLCVVTMALIILVSFVGIYAKDGAFVKGKLPDYRFTSELNEKRNVSLSLGLTEEHIHDKDGNEVEAIPEGANKDDYSVETTHKNKQEDLTLENYKKAREVLIKRLDDMGVEDYLVRLDEATGKVTLELEDNTQTDEMMSYLLGKGDFSITDSKSGDVLLGKSDIASARMGYNNTSGYGTAVILSIKLNKEGKEKLLNITRDYKEVEQASEGEENSESSENSEEKEDNQKKVNFIINGTTMFTTAFDEEITTGELPISLGTATDTETLQNYLKTGTYYAMFLNNDDLPLTFDIDDNRNISGNVAEKGLEIAVCISAVVFALTVIYLVVKYSLNGLLAGLAELTAFGLLLLIIRYTKTEISLNSIFGFGLLAILNVFLISKMLKKIKSDSSYENIQKATVRTYLENFEIIVVSLIIAIVFTFMQTANAYSFGMTLFYGVISLVIANLVFLRTLLLNRGEK